MGRMHDINRETANLLSTAPDPGSAVPDLSFIIPAYNEAETITETLNRVSRKARRLVKHAEILVVDDGSTDETLSLVKSGHWEVPVRLLRLSRLCLI